jgi:hypothetical protein
MKSREGMQSAAAPALALSSQSESKEKALSRKIELRAWGLSWTEGAGRGSYAATGCSCGFFLAREAFGFFTGTGSGGMT